MVVDQGNNRQQYEEDNMDGPVKDLMSKVLG
jgi:hypothetical protein